MNDRPSASRYVYTRITYPHHDPSEKSERRRRRRTRRKESCFGLFHGPQGVAFQHLDQSRRLFFFSPPPHAKLRIRSIGNEVIRQELPSSSFEDDMLKTCLVVFKEKKGKLLGYTWCPLALHEDRDFAGFTAQRSAMTIDKRVWTFFKNYYYSLISSIF